MAAYRRWLLTRSGRYERFDCIINNYYYITVTMALNLCHFTGVLFLIVCDYLICRYAATGACNIFVFVVTWIFLGTNEDSTSSNKLGSSDATAFMVNTIGQVVHRLKSPGTSHSCLFKHTICSWKSEEKEDVH